MAIREVEGLMLYPTEHSELDFLSVTSLFLRQFTFSVIYC